MNLERSSCLIACNMNMKKCMILQNMNCEELKKKVNDIINRENVLLTQFSSNNNLLTCFIIYEIKENKSKKKER